MNNWIRTKVKHKWNIAVHVLYQNLWYALNTQSTWANTVVHLCLPAENPGQVERFFWTATKTILGSNLLFVFPANF